MVIVIVAIVAVAVVALERVSSASHWARESRTVDSVWDAICGGVVVVLIEAHSLRMRMRMRMILWCCLIGECVVPWMIEESPLTEGMVSHPEQKD